MGGRPPLRSVDSQIKRRVIEPRNFLVVSPRLGQSRGPRQALRTWSHQRCPVTPGSESRANDHEGSPGTWETLPSPSSTAGRRYRLTNSRLIRGPASGADGDERRTQRWYRQAKETKRGEKGGRESERLIVPMKRGNRPEGPRGGKGVPRRGQGVGTTPRTPCLAGVSPRDRPGRVRDSGIHDVTNRMRLTCTSGSSGDLGVPTQAYPARNWCPIFSDMGSSRAWANDSRCRNHHTNAVPGPPGGRAAVGARGESRCRFVFS